MLKTFLTRSVRFSLSRIGAFLKAEIYFCKYISRVPENSIVFFPIWENRFTCGLSGIIAFKNRNKTKTSINMDFLNDRIQQIESRIFISCKKNAFSIDAEYLGGDACINSLFEAVQELKEDHLFSEILTSEKIYDQLSIDSKQIEGVIESEAKQLSAYMGHLGAQDVELISQRIERLKDIRWCLAVEVMENVKRVKALINSKSTAKPDSESNGFFFLPSQITIFKKINSVLNSIDRLEVRGRDSAGISLMFLLAEENNERFKKALEEYDGNTELLSQLKKRSNKNVLVNNCVSIQNTIDDKTGKRLTAISIVYKIAAEIGCLGDNIKFLRQQISTDLILQILTRFPMEFDTVAAHTRWASVGAITEENCHPVDNLTTEGPVKEHPIIHACLNGDIDNYLSLKKEFEGQGSIIPENITTDTKIIPLQIEKYIKKGMDPEEAFRLAVNDFEGSHAIAIHTSLAPGKLFLAQKGSGQAVFIGLSDHGYMATSEVYGFVETTPYYLKLDGEKVVEGKNGKTCGQIFILDQNATGGVAGIKAFYYDGTPVILDENDIKYTHITSRDIDRQGFPHYFLKEISESPVSVEKTLQNRWKIGEDGKYRVTLDEKVVPVSLTKALLENKIRRVYFMGQGTAGVAAQACADILNHYLNDPLLNVSSLKSSELSGFKLDHFDGVNSMSDTLIVAISQSGTTTDTNRTIDMVRERGAHTIAIVNRRDSDITFKVDGVLYTSSGRDIEMSVASTKAFYSQIIAGAILGLYIAKLKGRRDDGFVTNEIKQLLKLPIHMRQVLSMKDEIEKSAKRLAVTKTYWAAVGSGSNKASADEIRIKLSELCYKTISSDFVEDKKHIDLSSEPLIIVCAAGTRETVLGDIIKDTAIFHAHKALPVVITDEGEERFNLYAESVFHVPLVSEHLAPVLNTLVGHIWGYYAALSINDASQFMYTHRQEIQSTIDAYANNGLNVYEIILEETFREKIAKFHREFTKRRVGKGFPSILGFNTASDLTLLLKYLSGRLPVSDFEIDFGKKGTALNIINTLLECLSETINSMARPIDAIKHQAKTVTVGTSRISEKVEGILFDAVFSRNIKTAQLTTGNIIVLKNLQGVIDSILGAILYKIDGLSFLGEPTDDTTIRVLEKEGILKPIPSRVEVDFSLKGTKRIIVRQGNVYIGKGRKDDRSIVVIPILSAAPSAPNLIEYLLLLNISFKENIELPVKKKALGGKYEHIKNIVQENSVQWSDEYLELVDTKDLFGSSAEKIAEYIVFQKKITP